MTVGELLDVLADYDRDLEVIVRVKEGGALGQTASIDDVIGDAHSGPLVLVGEAFTEDDGE